MSLLEFLSTRSVYLIVLLHIWFIYILPPSVTLCSPPPPTIVSLIFSFLFLLLSVLSSIFLYILHYISPINIYIYIFRYIALTLIDRLEPTRSKRVKMKSCCRRLYSTHKNEPSCDSMCAARFDISVCACIRMCGGPN